MLGAPVIVSPTASPRRIPAPGGFVCAPDQGMQSRLQVLDAAERKSPAAPESPAEPSPLPRGIFGALERRRNALVSGYAHFGVDEDV
jgi:hypothetical protein